MIFGRFFIGTISLIGKGSSRKDYSISNYQSLLKNIFKDGLFFDIGWPWPNSSLNLINLWPINNFKYRIDMYNFMTPPAISKFELVCRFNSCSVPLFPSVFLIELEYQWSS